MKRIWMCHKDYSAYGVGVNLSCSGSVIGGREYGGVGKQSTLLNGKSLLDPSGQGGTWEKRLATSNWEKPLGEICHKPIRPRTEAGDSRAPVDLIQKKTK